MSESLSPITKDFDKSMSGKSFIACFIRPVLGFLHSQSIAYSLIIPSFKCGQ